MTPWLRARARRSLCAVALLFAAAAPGGPALAQTDAQAGSVAGRVFDATSGAPLDGVSVVLRGEGRREVQVTQPDGGFAFGSLPPGLYSVTFTKSGYRDSTMTDLAVQAGEESRADFPLPPQVAAPEDPSQIEEFVVTAETIEDLMTLRIESDQLLNVVGAEEFSKFAAGDVAEVLERVAGVNIVEGQFAIIRGLEDRYSSTLYNGAPVPSPDPDRQSVQLDLFPSEVVGNLQVSKTFSPELPSNSSGGAIDIITHEYPDEVELKLKAGSGFNDNAKDRFIHVVGSTDVDRMVHGLDPIGTGPDGLPIYPDTTLLKAEGFRFVEGNPVGRESEKTGNWIDDVIDDVIERDLVGSLGGRKKFGGREFRLKAVVSNEVDYSTALGKEQSREPRGPVFGDPTTIFDPVCGCLVVVPGALERSGDLTLGILSLTEGQFDLTVSQRETQSTGYAAFGFDLDDEGNHKIDASVFYTKKEEDTIEYKENGYLPGFDSFTASQQQLIDDLQSSLFEGVVAPGSFIGGSIRRSSALGPQQGALAFTNFFESTSFERDRDLVVYQMNGDHTFDPLPGFHVSWAINQARTTQDEVALGMKYFYEPCGYDETRVPCPLGTAPIAIPTEAPVSVEELGPGVFAAQPRLTLSANAIEEDSWFYRIDADQQWEFSDQSVFTVAGGIWFERAERSVDSAFLESPGVAPDTACLFSTTATFACLADTPLTLGRTVFDEQAIQNGNLAGSRITSNESSREIDAWHLRGKFTFWEIFDLLGGARSEKIRIESLNDPFLRDPVTGEIVTFLGGPQTFPGRFLFFDRRDNPFQIPDGSGSEVLTPPPAGFFFNDQLLGIDLQPGACAEDNGSIPGITCVDFRDEAVLQDLFNGEIDERRLLPSAGFAVRPLEGLSIRGAWSQTVARPSFREMGYYVSVEPGSDDLIVGNPQLQLSDVESYDGRVEYVWGGRGDLFAFSYFKKTVERPIESIIVRDPVNVDLTATQSALFRTFFNNPDTAELWGAEVEMRKAFDFLGPRAPGWLKYLSIGGNYTYIDAEVARTEAELARSQPFFALKEGDMQRFAALDSTRRLFNQPKWIFNADLTFDHPDSGWKATVAWFGISDVLDAVGTATLAPTGDVLAFTLDRYVDSYGELRATISKTFQLPDTFGELTFRATAKNLTDSERRIVYDPYATGDRITDREVHLGRDYDFSITYTRNF